ncbi:MAG TPA: PQ-loop repeat-containing protein [Candidatus Omnitrophota bacterium]|nr:PQ-loop repeat-containing protein [Candidatus Omnitrophota bacterium]
MITEVVGWLGVGFGVSVSIPQLIKSVRARSTNGLSKHTYQLLLATIICYLVRAIAIGEIVFIVSNVCGLIVTTAVLYLFRKYPAHKA